MKIKVDLIGGGKPDLNAYVNLAQYITVITFGNQMVKMSWMNTVL